MLSLELENNQTVYAPGTEVRGVASWMLDYPPKDIKLALLWYTEGIGTQDIGIVEEQNFDPTSNGQTNFSFALPDSPYSFTGTHITLKWAVELTVNKGKESQRIEFIMSPWGETVKLEKVAEK